MNCESARTRLLAVPDPAAPSESVAGHLAGCPACRAWHRLLVGVEAGVAALPVPASDGKAKRQLLEQFRPARGAKAKPAQVKAEPAPAPKPSAAQPAKAAQAPKGTVQPAGPRVPLGERLARMWPAGLVAAAVLVGVVTWSMFGGGKKPPETTVAKLPPDPFLQKAVASKVALDTAKGPADKLRVLNLLAKDIDEEARDLARVSPAEVESLARMYEQVVTVGLVEQVKGLDDGERKKLTPYLEALAKTEQEANRLAQGGVPPEAIGPLTDIAKAAAKGKGELARAMLGRVS